MDAVPNAEFEDMPVLRKWGETFAGSAVADGGSTNEPSAAAGFRRNVSPLLV